MLYRPLGEIFWPPIKKKKRKIFHALQALSTPISNFSMTNQAFQNRHIFIKSGNLIEVGFPG